MIIRQWHACQAECCLFLATYYPIAPSAQPLPPTVELSQSTVEGGGRASEVLSCARVAAIKRLDTRRRELRSPFDVRSGMGGAPICFVAAAMSRRTGFVLSDKMNWTVGFVSCFLRVPLVYLSCCPAARTSKQGELSENC